MFAMINDNAGRGMKNGENFQLLYDLAGKLKAAGVCVCVCVKMLTAIA